jgi:hypothetical protein
VAATRSAAHSAIPKLTAGTRYLKEQLIADGAKILPSEDCLKDVVLDTIEAVTSNPQKGESYIASLRRHLESRARFILRWMSTDEALEDAACRGLLEIARKRGLRRSRSLAGKPSQR